MGLGLFSRDVWFSIGSWGGLKFVQPVNRKGWIGSAVFFVLFFGGGWLAGPQHHADLIGFIADLPALALFMGLLRHYRTPEPLDPTSDKLFPDDSS